MSLIHITASGGFKPTKFSGCALWLAADKGVTTVDGNVSSWADQSGNGNHASQSTVASRPAYVASAQGSRPTLRFDGSAKSLLTPTINILQPNTVFVVTKANNALGMLFAATENSATYIQQLWVSSIANQTWNFAAGRTAISGNAVSNSSVCHVITVIANGTSSSIYIEGSRIANGNPGTLGINILKIGREWNDAHNYDGDISEIIIFNRALTDAERIRVEQYLSGKYAITLA